MRILHVSEVIKGGVCTYLREVIALQRHLYGPGCVAAIVPDSQKAELPVPTGVELVTFDDRSTRVVGALRLARATRKLISAFDPDVVHIHSTFAGAVLRPLLAFSRCKAVIIYCPHGWAFDRDSPPFIGRCVKLLEWLWSHWCDAVVCVSDYERAAAIRIGVAEDKLILVRNGLPRRAPEADPVSIEWPRGSRRLLFVGRFDRQKGIDILFDALRELGDDAFAIIAGDSLRVSLGALPKNARYAGWLTPAQLEAYYRSAEVVVMPSRWEGFGLVAVEAMRAGLPVIASSVGGLTEIIEDGKTGVLVKPNDVAALVAALRGLDEQSLRVMGDAAYKRFLANFTIDDAFRSLCDLYHRFEQKSAITEELNDLTAR